MAGATMMPGSMGPGAALLAQEAAATAEPTPGPGKEKPASDFDLAADRAFQSLGGTGDSVGFRSALRSAIKIIINDMKL